MWNAISTTVRKRSASSPAQPLACLWFSTRRAQTSYCTKTKTEAALRCAALRLLDRAAQCQQR